VQSLPGVPAIFTSVPAAAILAPHARAGSATEIFVSFPVPVVLIWAWMLPSLFNQEAIRFHAPFLLD
jgi:hypothetical protein